MRCPRCGAANARIEKPWAHLHCPDCGLRRYISPFEENTRAGTEPPRSPEPTVNSQPRPEAQKSNKVKKDTLRGMAILIGAPAGVGFVFGSQIGALVCVALILINVILLVRKRWEGKYAIYAGLALALFLGGVLRDVVFPPTARCADGTYSYSAHHSGTCSWHGGVAQWNPDPWWESIFD